MPGAPGQRLPWLVPGTAVVAYLLATGRWGSYLGVPSRSVYVTDLLLGGSLLWAVVRHRSAFVVDRRALLRMAPVMALLVWAVVRAFAGGMSRTDAFRDLAPYAYLVVAGLAVVRWAPGAGARTFRVLIAALILHAAWVTFALVDPTGVGQLPMIGGQVRLLSLRQDWDGSMLAVLAGSCLYLAVRSRSLIQASAWLGVTVWASALVPLLASRASLLALISAFLVASLCLVRPLRPVMRRWPTATAVVVVLLIGLLAITVPQTPIYKRLAGDPAYAQNGASGTAQARQTAWAEVLDYTNRSGVRVAFGVGMGPDFLKASGASINYQAVGKDLVRQPHNFLINTYARLGALGLLLMLWLLTALARRTWTILRSEQRRAVDLIRVLLVVTLLTTSLIGVILESPFGMIPFAWAAGGILMYRHVSAHRPAAE